MNIDQQGKAKVFIIVLIVVALLAGFYWWSKKQAAKVYAPSPAIQQSTMQNDQELTAISQDLDNTDIDGAIDNELNQNDADAASF